MWRMRATHVENHAMRKHCVGLPDERRERIAERTTKHRDDRRKRKIPHRASGRRADPWSELAVIIAPRRHGAAVLQQEQRAPRSRGNSIHMPQPS